MSGDPQIRLFLSSISGNKEIKRKQDQIVMILEGKKVAFAPVDIADPGNENEKQFMRDNGVPKEGQTVPLPPQLFNGDQYLGDHEAFMEAVELDTLEQFLKLS